MEVKERVNEIKGQLRLFMNGVASQSMREKGLGYKINYGIELPRLVQMASAYEKNHALAQALWREEIRECKILAGLLQPVDTFDDEWADLWMAEARNPEIIQVTCMNLFQHLPYALAKAFQWMADERELMQLGGYTLMARLLMNGQRLEERNESEFLDQALAAIESGITLARQAVVNSLVKYVEQDKANGRKLGRMIKPLANSSREDVKSVAQEIKSHIDYWT